MISCTEFIPAYSELFKYLDERHSHDAVVAFWENLSDNFLGNLRDYVERLGVAGCFEYWSHTLTEEAADFRMTLDEEKGVFEIHMRHCPSRGRLNETEHITPYYDYCRHCDVLYRRVLEPLGYRYEFDDSRCEDATCTIRVSRGYTQWVR